MLAKEQPPSHFVALIHNLSLTESEKNEFLGTWSASCNELMTGRTGGSRLRSRQPQHPYPGNFVYTVSAMRTGTTSNPTLAANTTVNVTVPAGISTNLPPTNP